MLIRVIYPDSRFDMVKQYLLDDLITTNRITKFRRRDGWVTLGVDPVRNTPQDIQYCGPERRSNREAAHYAAVT